MNVRVIETKPPIGRLPEAGELWRYKGGGVVYMRTNSGGSVSLSSGSGAHFPTPTKDEIVEQVNELEVRCKQ